MVVVTVVVGVVAPRGQVAPAQASQQLGPPPAQAVPPIGALHACAFFLTPQWSAPFAVVRQHATAPGRPQVDAARQRLVAPLQAFGTVPALAAARSTPAAQRM